jgi:hypothetical protein
MADQTTSAPAASSTVRRMRVLPVICVLALAGCGGGGDKKKDAPKTGGKATILNTAKVSRAIEASIAKQRNLKARVVCPTGVAQQKGLKFACLASYKGGQTTFTVDQTDDKGNVTYEGQ